MNLKSGKNALLNDVQVGRTLSLMQLETPTYRQVSQPLIFIRGHIPYGVPIFEGEMVSNEETWLTVFIEHLTISEENHPPDHSGLLTQYEFDNYIKDGWQQLNWAAFDINTVCNGSKFSQDFLGHEITQHSLLLENGNGDLSGFNPDSTPFRPSNMIITGSAGSGRSQIEYQLLLKHLHADGHVVCMDYQSRFGQLTELLCGHHVTLKCDKALFDPFRLLEYMRLHAFETKSTRFDYYQAIYEVTFYLANSRDDFTLDELAPLYKLCLTYKENDKTPTLLSIYNELDKEETKLRNALYPYAKGHLAYLFEENSYVAFDNNLTTFEFEEIAQEPQTKSLAVTLLTLLSDMWFRTLEITPRKMIHFSEAWKLLDSDTASPISKIVREGRKNNIKVCVSTNCISDIQRHETTNQLLTNDGWLLMAHQTPEAIHSFVKSTDKSEEFYDLARRSCCIRNAGVVQFVISKGERFGSFKLHSDPYTASLTCEHPQYLKSREDATKDCSDFPLTRLAEEVKPYFSTPR